MSLSVCTFYLYPFIVVGGHIHLRVGAEHVSHQRPRSSRRSLAPWCLLRRGTWTPSAGAHPSIDTYLRPPTYVNTVHAGRGRSRASGAVLAPRLRRSLRHTIPINSKLHRRRGRRSASLRSLTQFVAVVFAGLSSLRSCCLPRSCVFWPTYVHFIIFLSPSMQWV